MEYVDTAMLIFIISTLMYLVRKTSKLCHDVDDLKKKIVFWYYSELLFKTFNVAMTVTGMVMLARITPRTANSLSMKKGKNWCDIYSFTIWANYILLEKWVKNSFTCWTCSDLVFFLKSVVDGLDEINSFCINFSAVIVIII